MPVSHEYLERLPEIYKDILRAFPEVEPARKSGWALAYQTLFEAMESKYSMSEIMEACENMQRGGAVTIKNRIFVSPTGTGEEIIAGLTGAAAPRAPDVPPFVPPTLVEGESAAT